ncbi:TlpA family protein disulfide reductase [Poriferisphaera corsica]|uniref:TlpA family protein disulfide reductase n=1 Tax=Poriferisphaera corsica TaxID=2528020 RepID=UPI0036F1A790
MGTAPSDFTLKNLDDKDNALADLLEKNKVVILDFWATWCPPCRMALPEMEKLQKWADSTDLSLQIYAVNAGEDPYTVKDFWEQNNMTLPVLLDADGSVMDKYGINSIPQTFIIIDGKIEHIHAGYVENMSKELQNKIESLLAPKPEPEAVTPDAADTTQSDANPNSSPASSEPQAKPKKPKRAPAAPL